MPIVALHDLFEITSSARASKAGRYTHVKRPRSFERRTPRARAAPFISADCASTAGASGLIRNPIVAAVGESPAADWPTYAESF